MGQICIPAMLGRSGIRVDKREGDGASPRGIYRLKRLWYRGDKQGRPRTGLPVRRIRPDDGWCDDPEATLYNRPIRHPAAPSHERMWRDDSLYDLVIELDHNTRPCVRRRGSAIFIHVARPDLGPTAGCVALPATALRRLLRQVGPKTRIMIR